MERLIANDDKSSLLSKLPSEILPEILVSLFKDMYLVQSIRFDPKGENEKTLRGSLMYILANFQKTGKVMKMTNLYLYEKDIDLLLKLWITFDKLFNLFQDLKEKGMITLNFEFTSHLILLKGDYTGMGKGDFWYLYIIMDSFSDSDLLDKLGFIDYATNFWKKVKQIEKCHGKMGKRAKIYSTFYIFNKGMYLVMNDSSFEGCVEQDQIRHFVPNVAYKTLGYNEIQTIDIKKAWRMAGINAGIDLSFSDEIAKLMVTYDSIIRAIQEEKVFDSILDDTIDFADFRDFIFTRDHMRQKQDIINLAMYECLIFIPSEKVKRSISYKVSGMDLKLCRGLDKKILVLLAFYSPSEMFKLFPDIQMIFQRFFKLKNVPLYIDKKLLSK